MRNCTLFLFSLLLFCLLGNLSKALAQSEDTMRIKADASWKASHQAGSGWEQPGYGDNVWTNAAAPSPGLCTAIESPNMWHPSGGAVVYLRKEFFVPGDSITAVVYRTFGVDDDADVYINGQLVTHNIDCWATELNVPVQLYLKPGWNTIAIMARDCGGCYAVVIDFDIVYKNACAVAKPTIKSSAPTTNVCPGKTVTLTSSVASSYLWNTGDTTRKITANAAGKYAVRITDANGCKNTSDTTVVTYQSCGKPTNLAVSNVTASGATLSWSGVSCAVAYQHEWRVKGTTKWSKAQTPGTSQILTGLAASTTYEWRVLTKCQTTPTTIKSSYTKGPSFTTASSFTAKSAIEKTNGLLTASLMPNPAVSSTLLTISGAKGNVAITLTDISGKILWQSGKIKAATIRIPVGQLANGIYMVTIKDEQTSKFLKLVISK